MAIQIQHNTNEITVLLTGVVGQDTVEKVGRLAESYCHKGFDRLVIDLSQADRIEREHVAYLMQVPRLYNTPNGAIHLVWLARAKTTRKSHYFIRPNLVPRPAMQAR